jgi:hypothetical protein
MDIYRSIVYAHVAAGSIALLTFWIAASARKGRPVHRSSGKIYLSAMLVVLATALAITGWFIARGQFVGAVFLAYLGVITATACWSGWRAIQLKRQPDRYFGGAFRAVAWANVVSGLTVFGAGVWAGSWLLMLFCWIGILAGIAALRQQVPDPRSNGMWWLREHYGAMIGNGVATHIAFLNLGLGRLLQPLGLHLPELFGWLAPVAVALIAGVWLDRKYSNKPRGNAQGAIAQSATGSGVS